MVGNKVYLLFGYDTQAVGVIESVEDAEFIGAFPSESEVEKAQSHYMNNTNKWVYYWQEHTIETLEQNLQRHTDEKYFCFRQ